MKIFAVLFDVCAPRQRLQVGGVIVERIPVFMVDDPAFRDRPVTGFPNNDGAQTPRIRLGNLNESAGASVLVAPHRNGTNGHSLMRDISLLKFSLGRQMNALDALVPRLVAIWKCVCGWFSRTPFIAALMLIGHGANRHVPFTAATLAAEAGLIGAIRFNLKRTAAHFAGFLNHAEIIPQNVGSGSTGIAQPDLFVEQPKKAEQLRLDT